MAGRYRRKMEQVGWLVWRRCNGNITPTKFSMEYPSMFPDSRRTQEVAEVIKYKLDAVDWDCSLDELAKKYPMPTAMRTGGDR